jgi:hypothetical protein
MRRAGALWLPCALLSASPALAAGGAHVVDDAAVETPGGCHLENWVSAIGGGSLVDIAPACTPKALSDLEIGGFVTQSRSAGATATTIGLAPKLALRSEARGLGIGLSASIGYGTDRGQFENASLVVPLTIPAGKALRFNLNAGWQWSRADHAHDLFLGGQVEATLSRRLALMAEAFGRDRRKVGGQAGLRWTSADGRADVDLLAGRYLDGATRNAITVGMTLRR